jgi:cytochrome P450
VTTYRHGVEVEQQPGLFSSDAAPGGIALAERPPGGVFPSFIAMDPSRHTGQRKSVSPLLAQDHVAAMEATIRAHAAEIPDGLPVAEEFDWADRNFQPLSFPISGSCPATATSVGRARAR